MTAPRPQRPPDLVLFDALAASYRWLARWPHGFIALWLVAQLVIPLHYYLVRRDDHDERFAWRMFSPMRMLTCSVELTVDGKPVALTHEFHDAWEKIAQRGRRTVVGAMGKHLCRRHRKPVVAHLTCQPVQGAAYDVGGFDLCQTDL